MSTCDESTNGMASPKVAPSTLTAAADCTEWPDVYSGKGGVEITVANAGSNTRCMYVTGRTTIVRYFVRQHPMNASAMASEVSALSSTA